MISRMKTVRTNATLALSFVNANHGINRRGGNPPFQAFAPARSRARRPVNTIRPWSISKICLNACKPTDSPLAIRVVQQRSRLSAKNGRIFSAARHTLIHLVRSERRLNSACATVFQRRH